MTESTGAPTQMATPSLFDILEVEEVEAAV